LPFAVKMPTEAKTEPADAIPKEAVKIGLQNKGPKKEERVNNTTPNRGNNNFRNNGNQIGLMGSDSAPNSGGTKKRPWERNTSVDSGNDSPGFSGNQRNFNQGSGRRSIGQDRDFKKSPWGRKPSADNYGSPGFTGSPGDFNQGPGRRSMGGGRHDYITEKLREISDNLHDLKPREEIQKKFSNQARLWVGNIAQTTKEEELKELFKPYGEWDEFWIDLKKGFGFIRMDYKSNAVKAQVELNNKSINGRELRIRLSPTPGTALKVRNLSPHVTTELLEKVFEVFGELERVIVHKDDRGNSACEGVVEYCKKAGANMAMRKCQESCLYLSASLRPVMVEPLPFADEAEGLGELNINKRDTRYYDERQRGPRLTQPGSFEQEFGERWKKLYESYDVKKKEIESIMLEESRKLDMQMELAKHEHDTEMLRKKLLEREEANQRTKLEFEQRMTGYGGFGNNFPKYEDEQPRQKEESNQYQSNLGNRWEDTHYDSLYNDAPGGAHSASFGGNNFRNTDQQGGNKMLDELSKPLDNQIKETLGLNNQGSDRGNFDNQGSNRGNFDNHGSNRGSFNNQGNSRGNFDNQGNNRGSFNNQGNSRGNFDNQGNNHGNFNNQGNSRGNFDNQGNNRGNFNNQGNSRGNFDSQGNDSGNLNNQGMNDSDDFNTPKRARF